MNASEDNYILDRSNLHKEVKVSVIIPTYNRCDFVQESIDSVLSQSYTDYELIIVDDGSTDNTENIIKSKYAEKVLYYRQLNQGVSIARNLGISVAKGQYLAFLDSDDKWHPDKLKYQVAALDTQRQKVKKTALVCSSVWLIDKNGKLLKNKPTSRLKNIEKFQAEDFLIRPRIFAPPSNALFVREYVKAVGGFEGDMRWCEDWLLLVRLREKFSFSYIDKPLTYYRIHNVYQSRFPKKNEIAEKLADYLKLIEKAPKSVKARVNISRLKSSFYEKIAYFYFLYEDWNEGGKNILQASNLNTDCVENYEKFIPQIASSGLDSAIYHVGDSIPELLNYFHDVYYVNLQSVWPNSLMAKQAVKRKSWGAFCHFLVCDHRVPKDKLDTRYLCLQAFLKNPRYLMSLTTWKLYLSSF